MTAGGSSFNSISLRPNHRRRYSNHKMNKSTLAVKNFSLIDQNCQKNKRLVNNGTKYPTLSNYVNARPLNNGHNGSVSTTAKSRPHSRASVAETSTSAANHTMTRQRSLSQTEK